MNRVDITLTLNLPQDLVEEAKSAGLLSQGQIERWLTDELDRQRKLDHLAEVEPSLSEDEINAEVEAHRREERQKQSDN